MAFSLTLFGIPLHLFPELALATVGQSATATLPLSAYPNIKMQFIECKFHCNVLMCLIFVDFVPFLDIA
jgi:hypothetical protein